jgi:GNAT superfamily N-acetyltransferase
VAVESAPEKGERRAEKAPAETAAIKPADTPKERAPLLIERLTHADVDDVVGLFRRVWDPYLVGMPPEVQRAWQPTPLEFTSGMEGVTYFAARRGSRIVGTVGCAIEDGACHLLNLCVDKDHRHQGVATALLAAALGWAQHANARSIYVDVLVRFGEARTLLLGFGFTEAGILHRHFHGEDVHLFEKLL